MICMKSNIVRTFIKVMIVIITVGCDSILDIKSDKKLVVATTVDDFQALLNSGNISGSYCSAGEASSDDYFVPDVELNTLDFDSDYRLYTWQPDYVSRTQSSAGDEWYNCYRAIYVCNSVLYDINRLGLSGKEIDNVRGQALALRAFRYLDAMQIWSPVYNKATASEDLGVVIRLDPDMNLPSERATVQEVYDQIIKDLLEAVNLLPLTQAGLTLPSKGAAHGLLSRAYLFMADYEKALYHAEQALGFKSNIIDFNDLNPANNFPIPAIREASEEVVLRTRLFSSELLIQRRSRISPELYSLYEENDLRKSIYFRINNDSTITFKGTHMGHQGLLNGVSTSELYLIAGESNLRIGNLKEAERFLNTLLVRRWRAGTYQAFSFSSYEDGLRIILEERRKELVFRGLRWPDLKRLNRDGANVSLTRIAKGEKFVLHANDLRYAIAIPETVIEISGIPQNPR